MNWQDVKFKECAVHNMIRYACAKCPVCQTEEAANLIISDLENQIASLEISRATAAAE